MVASGEWCWGTSFYHKQITMDFFYSVVQLHFTIGQNFFFFVTVIAGLLAGIIFESILFYVVFMLLRSYAGGIHARTETAFTALTTSALFASVLVIKQLELHTSRTIPLFMLVIGSLCILVFSPLDTDGKPLDKCEKRQYKTICIMILIICTIVALITWIHQIKSYSIRFAVEFVWKVYCLCSERFVIAEKIKTKLHESIRLASYKCF